MRASPRRRVRAAPHAQVFPFDKALDAVRFLQVGCAASFVRSCSRPGPGPLTRESAACALADTLLMRATALRLFHGGLLKSAPPRNRSLGKVWVRLCSPWTSERRLQRPSAPSCPQRPARARCSCAAEPR
jgi:hypothetical protein